MNEDILVGPIWNIEKLKYHYKRNVALYGELSIIKLEEGKKIIYIKKEELFSGK